MVNFRNLSYLWWQNDDEFGVDSPCLIPLFFLAESAHEFPMISQGQRASFLSIRCVWHRATSLRNPTCVLWSTKARHGWVFWKNQKGRSSWGFRFVSITINNLLIRINIFHCSKTGGSSTKQTHLDHWKVPKHGRLEIIFHVAKSDYGSWPKLGVISQFFTCTDFHHQDFSTIAVDIVDTQEWNGGSWGCGWGRMYCKVWHCAGRASWDRVHCTRVVFFVHKFVVYWIHGSREFDVYNFTTTFHPISPVGKH